MKYEITQKGANRDGKAFVVGDVIDIDGDVVPPSLISKGRILKDHAGKVAVTNPATGAEPKVLTGPFTVGAAASGWYPVLDADGKPVKKLRKDDAEAFASLSDEDKLAYLAD